MPIDRFCINIVSKQSNINKFGLLFSNNDNCIISDKSDNVPDNINTEMNGNMLPY